MKMLTKELTEKLPRLYSQEEVEDPMVWVKFFTPWTSWTWWGCEFDPEERIFFGLVQGLETELGNFSLDEMEAIRGPGGLKIERDLYFDPCPLSEVQRSLER